MSLRSASLRAACAAAVFAVALAVYTLTLAPTVTLVDSGELIVAADSLGVAHPPGFPLYVLLAHLASRLPFGTVAWRVNFASALFAAASAAMLVLAVSELLLTHSAVPRQRVRRAQRNGAVAAPPPDSVDRSGWTAFVPVLSVALMFAFARTLWSYAVIAEVYTLNTALIITVFFLMFRWRRAALVHVEPAGAMRSDRLLYAAAFVFGLGIGVHHVTVALTLPAIAVLVYRTAGREFFLSARLLYAAVAAFAGAGIYVYLPLAAAGAPVLNWGDPRTLQRLWWHITGRQYQVYFSFSPATVGSQAKDFAKLAARELGPWWLPAGPVLVAIGVAALYRGDRTLLWFLVAVLVADLAYALGYDIAEDKPAYYLPVFIGAALAAGYGAGCMLSAARRRWRAISVGALCLVPAATLAGNFRFDNYSRYWIARDYVDNVLSTVAPGGMLLTLDWQLCSPMLYVRSVEQRRRDVTLLDLNLLRRSWYFDYLRREYPEMIAAAREQVEAFLEDLRRWEIDPGLYQRDPALNRRIDTRFSVMIQTFVRQRMESAPVYVTQDIALNRSPQDTRLTQALTGAYQLVPQGLVFQLATDRQFHQPLDLHFQTRGLADGSLAFEADDVVRLKVLPVYVTMLYNRGRYLALHDRQQDAREAYRQALALDRDFAPAQQALAEIRSREAPH
jgi:hypothetical protein